MESRSEALFNENRIGATMWLFVIDLIDGKITHQEKKEMREMLLKITKGNKIPSLRSLIKVIMMARNNYIHIH